MSHISTVRSKIRFTDQDALKSALEQFGAVITNRTAMSLVLKTPPIPTLTSLTFMNNGREWQARQDNWGDRAQYEALVGKIGQQYSQVLTKSFIEKNHLSFVSQGTDAENNIKIKVRSY